MKDSILGLIVGILLVIICYCLDRCSKAVITEAVTSSPVEEMYHRQLVVTLDSVLDARLNAATLKEFKDKDSADIADHTHYEKYFVPIE